MLRTQFDFRENFPKKVRVTAYGALLLSTVLYFAPPSFADFDSDAEASADASQKQISESLPASDDSVRDALRSVFKETSPDRIKEKSQEHSQEHSKEVVKDTTKTKQTLEKVVAEEKPAPDKEVAIKGTALKEQQEEVAKAPVVKVTVSKAAATQSASTANHKLAFTGVADYYADMFHGRKTASGQLHDKTKMTAAHLSLPFGTKLKVVSRHNGKSCVVTVNDRGPYTKNRIIDLSLAAAKELGLVTAGSRLVDCYMIEPE